MFIKDAIFGNIELTPLEEKVVESAEMQRLRFIRQTGLVSMVYPGSNHSRFEHSLGTMNISKEMAKEMELEDDEIEIIALSGLLHDIGHGPFSHLSEGVFSKYLNTDHERNGIEIIKKSEIKDIIEKAGFSVNEIIKRLLGKEGGEIVTASLGADRLDYLLRDAHYTGVSYGVIDYQQIKSKMGFYRKNLAVYLQGVQPAESLLLARYFMFITVYHHHAVEIANKMLEEAMEIAIEENVIEPKEFLYLRDFELVNKLMASESIKPLIKRILERRLFKRAIYKEAKGTDFDFDEKAIKSRIEKSGLNRTEYIVAKNKIEFVSEKIPVISKKGARIGYLDEISPIIKSLMKNDITRFVIASDKKNLSKIRRIANLRYPTKY
ncbi:MAG: HD domain-containing protein [Candidatus Micrarchaeia archaeon]